MKNYPITTVELERNQLCNYCIVKVKFEGQIYMPIIQMIGITILLKIIGIAESYNSKLSGDLYKCPTPTELKKDMLVLRCSFIFKNGEELDKFYEAIKKLTEGK